MNETVTKEVMLERLADLLTCPEIDAAVNWWAGQLLGQVEHNNADAFQSFVATASARMVAPHPPSPKAVMEFKEALKTILMVRYAEGWKRDNPQWASYNRAIATDYGPGKVLRMALELAWIDNGDLRLPIKTIMWVNPGEVKVRKGYGSKEEVIWSNQEILVNE